MRENVSERESVSEHAAVCVCVSASVFGCESVGKKRAAAERGRNAIVVVVCAGG